MTHISSPAGYFITFTTYGERLHGDERGSVERLRAARAGIRDLPPDPDRQRRERHGLLSKPVSLDRERREAVADAVRGVCLHNEWHLHALNIRTNHVHIVVSGPGPPERMKNALKSWATRRLREAHLVGAQQKVWTRHGSTTYLWAERDILTAATYVLEGQGPDLGGVRWTPEP